MILAIDTCQDQCAVGIYSRTTGDKQDCLVQQVKTGQADILFPLIEQLLEQQACTFQDITCIGVTVGPGNFTGIRIGISAAQGLAMSLNVPVYGVTTLAAWAQTVHDTGQRGLVTVVLDARKSQQYVQQFILDDTTIKPCDVAIVEPQQQHNIKNGITVGSFAGNIKALSPLAMCRLISLGQTGKPSPFYIRKPDATAAPL